MMRSVQREAMFYFQGMVSNLLVVRISSDSKSGLAEQKSRISFFAKCRQHNR